MISCESAKQTINIYQSVIKFIEFKGIVWSGEGLPLVLNSLGELFTSQIRLTDNDGNKQTGLVWERGMLQGRFDMTKRYDLYMRLEYCLPVQTHVFKSDFQSIHPKAYEVYFDFHTDDTEQAPGQITVQVGDQREQLALARDSEREWDSGHRIRLMRQGDYTSVGVFKSQDAPYSHRHFPEFHLG